MSKVENKGFKRLIRFFTIFVLITCSCLLYSRYIATTGLFVKEYKITDSKITDNFHGLKIVHISDIHYGRTVKNKELKKLVKKINELKPDIVVLTGDLIDKDTKLTENQSNNISKILSEIDVSIEKYAITGNHDYKFKNFNIIIENAGFINLNNTYDTIYKDGISNILISGVSTNYYKEDNKINDKLKSTFEYLNSFTNKKDTKKPIYNILLIHEPDFIDEIDKNKFDLILSGHSHNGQVRFPIIGATILPPYAKKYYKEHYELDNTDLYISSGVGTSVINFRFFNRPSINFYRLTNK